MSADQRVETLRARPWFVSSVAAATLLFTAGALRLQPAGGVSFFLLASLAVLGGLALVDLALTRVTLAMDDLEIVTAWSRRRYRVDEIQSVKWERGARVALKLTSGSWVKLPELGRDSQALAHTLRRWVARRAYSHAPR